MLGGYLRFVRSTKTPLPRGLLEAVLAHTCCFTRLRRAGIAAFVVLARSTPGGRLSLVWNHGSGWFQCVVSVTPPRDSGWIGTLYVVPSSH
jgi:hypothetical protein